MSAPFCTGCGATVAAGTRFCVKCGQPIGQAAPAPPPVQPSASVVPPPPPPPSMPPPPHVARFPVAPDPVGLYPPPPPPKQGAGAGLWIGLFGLLLIICGAGLWYGFHTGLLAGKGTKQVAVTSEAVPAAPVAAPAPSTTPEVPPNPDFAKKEEPPPPNPDFAKKEEPPPNPDFAKKAPGRPMDQPVRSGATGNKARAASSPVPAAPPPTQTTPVTPKPASGQTSGTLHAAVEVALNGEVVFENLPAGRMRFTYDHTAWQPTIHRQANGTQTLIMRSLKPGIQRVCDVQWEIVQ